jgi:LytR cell envelope-related transcriptional attenuator
VDYPLQYDDMPLRPWRTAALLAAAVAAVELVLLVVVGGALIAKPSSTHVAAAKRSHVSSPAVSKPAAAKPHHAGAAVAELTRRHVKVLVLNGNGRAGAAAAVAARASHRGYRIGRVANAPRHDFTRSLVMYRRGFEGEAQRLARDLDIKIVGPLDGMRPKQLHGAHAVVVVGA